MARTIRAANGRGRAADNRPTPVLCAYRALSPAFEAFHACRLDLTPCRSPCARIVPTTGARKVKRLGEQALAEGLVGEQLPGRSFHPAYRLTETPPCVCGRDAGPPGARRAPRAGWPLPCGRRRSIRARSPSWSLGPLHPELDGVPRGVLGHTVQRIAIAHERYPTTRGALQGNIAPVRDDDPRIVTRRSPPRRGQPVRCVVPDLEPQITIHVTIPADLVELSAPGPAELTDDGRAYVWKRAVSGTRSSWRARPPCSSAPLGRRFQKSASAWPGQCPSSKPMRKPGPFTRRMP